MRNTVNRIFTSTSKGQNQQVANERNWTAEVNAELKQELVSVVSYPDRCPLFGDARFHGNCDGRLFLHLVKQYGASSIADPMMGSGTTQDAVNWLNAQSEQRIEYWGDDLSRGFDLERDELPGPFDFIWIHPPYWNIVHYSDDARDLSTASTYEEFCLRLTHCLNRCYDELAPNGHLAVLLGDVRRKGKYFAPVWDCLRETGCAIGSPVSVLVKSQHGVRSNRTQYSRLKHPRIMHETCLVFERRD